MKKPELAFVSQHTCIRAIKEATVLHQLGYNMHLIANKIGNTQFFKSTRYYQTTDEFETIVKEMGDKIDIWHVHNEPNWYAISIRKVLPKAKIVFDHHDSHHWRLKKGQTFFPEKEAATFYAEDVADLCADAFVAPSELCKADLKKRHKKPVAFVPSACPRREFRMKEFAVRAGLVLQGGTVTTDQAKKERWQAWRDYTELLTELRGKAHIFIYSPNFFTREKGDASEHYRKLGCEVAKYPYDQMMDRLGEHSWNLVGNWQKESQRVWEYALPNKFFDAIASGVPSVVFGCPEAANLTKKYDIGLIASHPKELIKRWGDHIEKRKNLLMCRDELSMEAFIKNLTDLYDEVL